MPIIGRQNVNKFKLTKEKIALTAILILSAILNFTNLSIEGYANEYYAAGVKSMTKSFSNFFFVAFDPTGFVTIDKPPIGFWLQAISAKIFGFHGWSIILPQALAGVISVWVLYFLIKRYYGIMAGLIAALALAVTPMFVAASRNNTIDNDLVLVLLIAAYFLFKALESGKLKHILLSLAFVGIGFNVKMLEAYFVIPAIYLTYFIASKIKFKKRVMNLLIGTVVLVAVSFSWAIVVDLIPAQSRPYVGSSSNNSEIELIVGHNGIERFSNSSSIGGGGMGKMPSGIPGKAFSGTSGKTTSGTSSKTTGETSSKVPSGTQGKASSRTSGGGGMSNSTMGGGTAGISRLFGDNDIADQISWLFPLAILGFVATALREKLKKPFDNERKLSVVFWITFLVPEFLYFTFTQGLFHPYYVTMLAVPIAALVGIGVKEMWELYKEDNWKKYLLPAAFILDGALELLILSYYYKTSGITKILMIAVVILGFGSAILLIINKLKNKEESINLRRIIVGLGLVGLLITPTFWSSTTLFYKMSGTFPSAGLELSSSSSTGPGAGMGQSDDSSKLISYLEANKTNEKYLLVTLSASGDASTIIANTNDSVMALGGFMSTDEIISLSEFKQLVKNGQVRYVMVQGSGANGKSSTDVNTQILNWAKKSGKLVANSKWSATTSSSKQTQGGGMGMSSSLYDLKGSVK